MNRPVPRRGLLTAAAVGLFAGCLQGTDGDDASVGNPESEQGDEPVETPDRIDPEDAGVTVRDVEITDVEIGSTWTGVTTEVTVENTGRFRYGVLSFRADVFRSGRTSRERESLGFEYVTRQFASGDRFDNGTRTFETTLYVDRQAEPRTNSDWFEVTVAVRRAHPV